MNTTVIGLFHDRTEAHACVHDLEKAGFHQSEISVLSHNRVAAETSSDAALSEDEQLSTGAAKGAAIGGVTGALLAAVALAIPGIGPIIAAGPITAALASAGVGAATGGMFGALGDMGVPSREAAYWTEGVKRGGTLVAVETATEKAQAAQDVLNRHGAADIEEQARQWSESGWSIDDAHSETSNFGDEGGSSQWGRTVLTADSERLRSRTYDRKHPDNRKD